MLFWLIAGFIAVPFVMAVLAALNRGFRWIWGLLALLSFYITGSIIAAEVYRNILHGTVLTTDVHHLLLNPWFLVAGAYLGLYVPYRMLAGLWVHMRRR